MPATERLAAYVAHGTFAGGTWEWDKLQWKEQK